MGLQIAVRAVSDLCVDRQRHWDVQGPGGVPMSCDLRFFASDSGRGSERISIVSLFQLCCHYVSEWLPDVAFPSLSPSDLPGIESLSSSHFQAVERPYLSMFDQKTENAIICFAFNIAQDPVRRP